MGKSVGPWPGKGDEPEMTQIETIISMITQNRTDEKITTLRVATTFYLLTFNGSAHTSGSCAVPSSVQAGVRYAN